MSEYPQQQPGPEQQHIAPYLKRFTSLCLIAAFLAALYFVNYRPDIDAIACTDEVIASNPEVVMLSTRWCPYCAKARSYFDKNKVHYCEYDIERTERGKHMYRDIGGAGVPVLIFANKYKLNGYDERSIERALQLIRESSL